MASTLVDTDDRYETLVEYLLGKTLIVDHIDHAIAISRKYRQSLRIVTLEGDLLSPGGSMSGGAFKNSSNLLGRRREMEDLEEKVRSSKERVLQLQKQIEEIRQKRTREREELVKRTEQMQAEYLNQNTLKLKLQEIQTQNAKMLSDHKSLQSEVNEIRQQMAEIEEEHVQIEKEMDLSREQEAHLETQIKAGSPNWRRKRQIRKNRTGFAMKYIHRPWLFTKRKSSFVRICSVFTAKKSICWKKRKVFRRICPVPEKI